MTVTRTLTLLHQQLNALAWPKNTTHDYQQAIDRGQKLIDDILWAKQREYDTKHPPPPDQGEEDFEWRISVPRKALHDRGLTVTALNDQVVNAITQALNQALA